MQISKKILNNLARQTILPQVQYLWVHISKEEKDIDGFCEFKIDEWAIKLNKHRRTISRHLKDLYNSHLIQKIRRSRGYKKGVTLFVCPLQPETTDCMTFYATFAKGELLNTADNDEPSMWLLFKDIYNRSGTIRFSQCSALLKGNEMKRCQNLIPGKTVCFSASLKVTQSDKEILAVTNVQPTQRYYYA